MVRRSPALARYKLRLDNGRCIYDSRDNGGEAHGPLFKGGRCERCWIAKVLSDTRRRCERALEKERHRLRGARDHLFIQRIEERLAVLNARMAVIMKAIEAKDLSLLPGRPRAAHDDEEVAA